MTEQVREARAARGWSQQRLIHEIEGYARAHLVTIATTASLKVYISEWENGRRTVSEPYSGILRALFGLTDDELFGRLPKPATPAVDGYDELVRHIDTAHSLSGSMVDGFLKQTELLRTFDRQLGAYSLVDHMTAHLTTLTDALTFAVLPGARRPIAQALAGAATLAAWQALDVGAADRAWRNYELGKSAAREADDVMYLAHAMGEQAFVLSDAGKSDLAISLVREGQRIGSGKISPRLNAWLNSAEAELCALAGQVDDSRRALDRAAGAMPDTDEVRDPDLASIFLNTSHLTRWRGHSLALLGDDDAVGELYDALATMDETFTRARAGLHCDLVQAHMIRGENSEAAEQLRAARLIANRTGSVRFRRRVERLTGQL